ncbi:MAG: hypothetical protein OXQ94_15930, partial [Gemmatimonadota bacterium]|nr:hypothetical protein [Gemmatimonadota bacterium]MDE2873167.1 hypothetical protein [Gemmatimonadota bacterium]
PMAYAHDLLPTRKGEEPIIVEVIDVNAGELLASATYPMGEAMQGDPLLPQGFFRNELTGYVYHVGEDGLPYVEIIEGVLEKR